jgi:hypothetical protein
MKTEIQEQLLRLSQIRQEKGYGHKLGLIDIIELQHEEILKLNKKISGLRKKSKKQKGGPQ